MDKKLYRSRLDNKIAGVCGGLGDYFNIDPTFIRIAMVLLIFADGIGVLAYIISWIVMPMRPMNETEEPQPKTYAVANMYAPGILLVLVGMLFLLNNIWWWFDFGYLWPIILIAIGALLIFGAVGRRTEENNGTHTTEVGR